jgi:hypothetical protein
LKNKAERERERERERAGGETQVVEHSSEFKSQYCSLPPQNTKKPYIKILSLLLTDFGGTHSTLLTCLTL